MVVEQLVSYESMRKKPVLIAVMAYLFVSFAMILTAMIYPKGGGLFVVTLITIPAIPMFLSMLSACDIAHKNNKDLAGRLASYRNIIWVYAMFFVGVALSVAFWASVLPQDMSALLFNYQRDELLRISGLATGGLSSFQLIFSNNIQVLMLMFVLSVLYGIGAIYLLVWNATIFGVFLGTLVRSSMDLLVHLGIFAFPAAFLSGIFNGSVRIVPHGVFEFGAFFLASVAGGILSVSFEEDRKKKFWDVAKDSGLLLLLSVLMLLLGAIIEIR